MSDRGTHCNSFAYHTPTSFPARFFRLQEQRLGKLNARFFKETWADDRQKLAVAAVQFGGNSHFQERWLKMRVGFKPGL